MKLKDSTVSLAGMHPEMVRWLPAIDEQFRRALGYELIITSANDGEHNHGSRHYIGCAIDGRTWTRPDSGKQISKKKRAELVKRLKATLPKYFRIISYDTHLHIELWPRGPMT